MGLSRYRHGETPRAILKKRVGKLTVVTQVRKVFPFFGEPETIYETKVNLRRGFWPRDSDFTLCTQTYDSVEEARIGHRKTVEDVRSHTLAYLNLDIITSRNAPF